ncbi:TPA: isopeptide-forming domain-containing fimbrial protein, partial [Streptococcus suis]
NGTYIFVEDKVASPYYNKQEGDTKGSELTEAKAVPFRLVLPVTLPEGTGYFNNTNKPLHVYPKNTEDKPTVKKEFAEGGTQTKNVAIGEEINYKITTKIPKGSSYKTIVWEDLMVEGLDYISGSLTVAYKEVESLEKNTHYTVTEDKRGFMVKVNEAGLKAIETAAKDNDVNITLTYKAVLNDSAEVDTAIPNKVKLIYGNRPSEFTEPKSTKPSNKQIVINKTWGEGVVKVPVEFGVYEKETGKLVTKVTLGVDSSSVTVSNLDDSKDYIVIEETSVPGSLPNYSNGDLGVINVNNKKNPNPNPLTPEDPKVITYGKRFVKTDDAAELNTTKKLTGAEFVVKNDENKFLALKGADAQEREIEAYKTAEKNYVDAVKNNQTDNLATLKATRDAKYEAMNMQWEWVDAQDKAFTFVSSADGKFEVKGLKAGNYKLVETKAPDGYALLTSDIPFEVAAKSWTTATNTPIEGHQRVTNKKVTIPQTGGIGTVVFTVVGLSAMVFAFIAMKKRQSEEEA